MNPHPRTLFELLTSSVSVNIAANARARLGLTLIIALMVLSSPVLIFLNPALISARSNDIDTSSYHSGFSLADKSTSPMSPTNVSPLDSDFAVQGALSSLTARQTNNIVNTNSFYDVVFLTASSGAIKTIQVTFPAGTTIPSGAFFNEAEGIGPGTASKSGQTITYTVTNAVNVPAGTKIRLEFANINNPLQVSASYTVTVTTRDAANAIIDGPSQSTAYTIKQVGTNTIADNSVTDAKLSLDSVYTVWQDITPGNNEILYERQTSSFDNFLDLSSNAGSSSGPSIAASGNNVYVVWVDNTPGNNEILYKRSSNGGLTFGSTINLSNNAGNSGTPALAASGNNVYVVWRDNTPGNNDILYKRSTNGGASFGSTNNLSNNAGFSILPAIAASGNNVYVVWSDDDLGNLEIFYRRSTDGNGASFGDTINLSNNAGGSELPAIAATGNNVYVVWTDQTPGNFEIVYKRSTNGGTTFSGNINLSNNAGFSDRGVVAASGNNVYVVWEDNTPGNFEILYKRSTNGGTTFGGNVNLSNNVEPQSVPAIAASENNVYVVWGDHPPGNSEILYERSTNGGASFGSTVNLSNNMGDSTFPAIAAFNNLT